MSGVPNFTQGSTGSKKLNEPGAAEPQTNGASDSPEAGTQPPETGAAPPSYSHKKPTKL